MPDHDLSNSLTVELPATFPQKDYTPFGYLDNPSHSAVFNRSGVIRSIPPVGFGFWARTMPWAYGDGLERHLSYLSFLHLGFSIDGLSLSTLEDFRVQGVPLVSRYHTRTLMSYDWRFQGLGFCAKYFLYSEKALVCLLSLENSSLVGKPLTLHVTNLYGAPGHPYWGCDGVVSRYAAEDDLGISKIWAYGDVFSLGASRHSQAYKATAQRQEWLRWLRENDLSSNMGALTHFRGGVDHVYTLLSYPLQVPAGEALHLAICLARGSNLPESIGSFYEAVRNAPANARRQLAADETFYADAPLLEGDWPETWKHGWIYDLETLRMNIRPPLGIFKHPWDAMQVHTPRSVLAETSLDTLCLSYADPGLAQEVLYGTFADAPVANVPCTREDGSMNMISESSAECGTGPNWGFPFLTLESIYARHGDRRWLRHIYPHLKAYLEWWLEHRTDAEGWFHADCSWESGQDGSRRFLSDTPGATADFVRTVDIEAAVTHATQVMSRFAGELGLQEEAAAWQAAAAERLQRVRSMYHDGWYRDVDARTGRPILLPDYFDAMMLSPVAVRLATPEQVIAIRQQIYYFKENPRYWLEWPSFMQPFSEAAWNAGLRELLAEVLSQTGNRIYARLDAHRVNLPTDKGGKSLAELYGFRIPGVASEYWPIFDLGSQAEADVLEPEDQSIYLGGENYGWGATFPALVIRNLVGFREIPEDTSRCFLLAPSLPQEFCAPGKVFQITNLQFRGIRLDVRYDVQEDLSLNGHLTCHLPQPCSIIVTDESDQILAHLPPSGFSAGLSFPAANGGLYRVSFQ